MKLYLRSQVVERAVMVHEDLEKIEEKKDIKIHNLQKTRQKNYENKVKSNSVCLLLFLFKRWEQIIGALIIILLLNHVYDLKNCFM